MSTLIAPPDLAAVHLIAIPATHTAFTARRVNWRDQADVHWAAAEISDSGLMGLLYAAVSGWR